MRFSYGMNRGHEGRLRYCCDVSSHRLQRIVAASPARDIPKLPQGNRQSATGLLPKLPPDMAVSRCGRSNAGIIAPIVSKNCIKIGRDLPRMQNRWLGSLTPLMTDGVIDKPTIGFRDAAVVSNCGNFCRLALQSTKVVGNLDNRLRISDHVFVFY